MEKPESLASVSGLSAESPGGVSKAVPGGVKGPGEAKVHSSESSPQSGSTFLHSQNSEERPRSILKNSSSILMKKTSSGEKKSQRWDEMNILATYHPADKDYGFMKADEPSTPFHRLQDDEDPSAGSSLKVTPASLAERFATMDNFLPKVLQYGDNKNSKTADSFAKTYSSDFDKHRKIHYSEGRLLKRNLPSAEEEGSSAAGASVSSSSQHLTMDQKPRPVEKGWAGIKNDSVLVTSSHVLDTSDSAAHRNPSASESTIRETVPPAHLQRKEYYSKGRYLRSCSHPELRDDLEDEEQDSETLRLQWTQEKETRSWKM